MIEGVAGATIDADLEGLAPGQTALLGVRILDGADELVARTTAGITEATVTAEESLYTITDLETPDWPEDRTTEPWIVTVAWDDGDGVYTEPLYLWRGAVPTGEPYFTVSEFRAKYPQAKIGRSVTDEEIADARDLSEQTIEHACGVAFVPRTATVSASGNGARLLDIGYPRLRTVTAASYDSGDITLDDLQIIEPSTAYLPTTWPRTTRIDLTISHGYDSPPERIKRAAMILTRNELTDKVVTDRALGELSEVGVVRLSTPGVNGAITGIPEVDATILQYRWPATQLGSIQLT